jgi:uncharacterized membrane protein YbhN (UPF0104 family)
MTSDAALSQADVSGPRAKLKRHRRAIAAGVVVVAVIGFVVFVLPQLSGLSGTLKRLRNADLSWIALAIVFEALSLASYAALFRTAFSSNTTSIGWRESTQITLAGTVASKLLATAGAGGVALTVWALRATGLTGRAITRRMLTFELLLYTVFAATVLIDGIGLRTGVLSGDAPWTLTVVPAAVAGFGIAAMLVLRVLPAGKERAIAARAGTSGRGRRLLSYVAAAPQLLRESTVVAHDLIRGRDLGLLGAVGYWAFDIGALWASLHAFGTPPPLPAVVMAYFVGQIANVIPIPGGIGGVEGGTIGALIAFGAPGALAVLGVLAYRLISFWLPTAPGGLAYIRLRQTVARWRREAGVDPKVVQN